MQDQRLIVALDFFHMEEVQHLVETLGDTVGYYKIGMQVYYSLGNAVLDYLRQQNKQIFFDLKLHDIPNTVAQSTAALTGLGVTMLDVHAPGGIAMMKAAKKAAVEAAAKRNQEPPKLVAITVLTSIDEQEWSRQACSNSITEQVVNLAKMAQEAGLDGVVASPQEASAIRAACGPDFLIVTPGIRPAGAAANDQIRAASPAQALANGSSHLVVGRPITQAPDPLAAALRIIEEMRGQA